MELRSRRKLSSNPVVNVKYKSSSSSDDDSDDSTSNSDDTLVRDGEIESDEDSDKETDPGTAGEAAENGEGLQRLPLADDNNLDLLGDEEIKDIRNVDQPAKKRKMNKPKLMWKILEKENAKWVAENRDTVLDFENTNDGIKETAEPSSDLTIPLLRFQKEWLDWALKQEASETRGGILADEMGMGKTIQAIALVLSKREKSQVTSRFTRSSLLGQSSVGLQEVKGTLVICPSVALTQWESEIKRFSAKGSTKVLLYHGPSRGNKLGQLSEYDFVLTTYALVRNEFVKKSCTYCGQRYTDKMMSVHLQNFCPQNPSINSEWVSPGSKSDRKTLKSSKVGSNTKHISSTGKGASFQSISKGALILHSVKWQRIILDEAQLIKDVNGDTANAVFALDSSFRWALSGTPIQNRGGELYSLILFLGVYPYSYHFCVSCDCKILGRRPSTSCESCAHHFYSHFCWWKKYIARPIRREGYSGDGKDAMILLKNKILKGIMLRRTKKGRAADLALPPIIVSIRRDSMDIKEEDYYNSMYRQVQAEFNTQLGNQPKTPKRRGPESADAICAMHGNKPTLYSIKYMQGGALTDNFKHVLVLVTRLRQAVNHPYLVEYSKKTGSLEIEMPCGICSEIAEEAVVTDCAHMFCNACYTDYTTSAGLAQCPKCFKLQAAGVSSLKSNENVKTSVKGSKADSILQKINLEDFQTSTKIDALKEEIRFMLERDGSAKAVVFSQFSPFLDLISYTLEKCDIPSVFLIGPMTMSARHAAIKKFKEDPDCRILLTTITTGGLALSLAVASHVFLMDPCWNPAVERQAMNRIHRIGQFKPTRVVRFVIENSIEERILELQEKKDLVFEGIVGELSEDFENLAAGDLDLLFRS